MNIVFLYEYTGIMAKPWIDAGCSVHCFDAKHEDPGYGKWFNPLDNENNIEHILSITGDKIDFIFGFPECTDLAVSGAAHFKKKAALDPLFQDKAVSLALLIPELASSVGCTNWAFENPVSVLSSKYRKPNFYFDPCDYGGYLPEDDVHPLFPNQFPPRDAYTKRTGIWHGKGFVVPDPKPVVPSPSGIMALGGKSKRTKEIRSCTPRGFAKAVFDANFSLLKG